MIDYNELRETIIRLLQDIHLYYPVGIPHLQEDYPGFQKINGIVESKINSLQKKGVIKPWNTLIRELEQSIEFSYLEDQAYYQFPNLICQFDLGNSMCQEVKMGTKLVLALSLLTEHYTIFYQYELFARKFFKETETNLREWEIDRACPKKFVLYGEENCMDKEKDNLELIKNSMSSFYPSYHFVPHWMLLNYEVKGVIPFGGDREVAEEAYPIFDLLFHHGNYFSLFSYDVLK